MFFHVVRQVRNRLAHCRHAFGLQGGAIKLRILDRQSRLVGDRAEQFEIVFAEGFDRRAVHDAFGRNAWTGRCIDVNRAHDSVPTLHRHAHRFVDTQRDDAAGAGPAFIVLRVAGQHAFAMRQHVVEDGLADLQRSLRVGAGFAIAAISGREVTGDLVK